MSIDAIVGLGLVAALSVGVLAAVSRQNGAVEKLATKRNAIRQAENTLAALQSGVESANLRNGAIRVESAAAGDAPMGMKWVRVSVKLENSRAEILGIVPDTVSEFHPSDSGDSRGMQ